MDLALTPKSTTSGRCIGFDLSQPATGLISVAYRFVKFLLTPIGTDPTDLTYGTEFGRSIMGNVDPITLEATVVQSVDYAAQKLQEYEEQRDADSTFGSAYLRKIEIDSSGVGATIYLEINNAAGKSLLTYITTGVGNGQV